ncbi:unnamed protein product [Ambrosiozyma monospora]|uniref:Unnamed protein product n=1 Tax=Ambrosiozyma monospora TaxID=43982 RepID=A0ACB5TPX0_AMBMO|nr:unnamed protein product [Ambrosiozyma monospora]
MASEAYRQLVQLVELGIDVSRVGSNEFGLKNGLVFLTNLDFLSLFHDISEKEAILSRLDELFPMLHRNKKACIKTNTVRSFPGTESFLFSDWYIDDEPVSTGRNDEYS